MNAKLWKAAGPDHAELLGAFSLAEIEHIAGPEIAADVARFGWGMNPRYYAERDLQRKPNQWRD